MQIATEGQSADLAKLFAKIAHITAAMKRVPKAGRNTFHKYDYATESDIVDAIRAAMGDQKLAIIPSVESTEPIQPDITRLFMKFIVACGDTGAFLVVPWIGDGQDKGDKGVYKAYTGAEKYFLMKLFMVATGDDPEQDSQPEPQRAAAAEPQRTQPPAQLRAQPPVNRVATKPAGLDRAAAIKKIKLMWLSEEANGYDLTQQHEEKYMPLENIGDVSDDELVALGHTVKARLQAAAVAAEIVEAGSSLASPGRALREIVEPEPAAA